MPAPRTFGSVDPARRKEAAQFTLQGLYEFDVKDAAGQVVHAEGEAWQETFTCLREAPPGVLDDLMATTGQSPTGAVRWNQLSVVRFLRGMLVPADEAKFDALMHDKARPLDFRESIFPLMDHLSNEVLGFPTMQPPG